ncbi:MAG: DUF4381 domain-containing protein [Methylococcales bacterium]|nr:DUF4381 domain-containing protein [Methylococcales bacterium]
MPPIQELPIRDIHLPETISWFPPAIGWWIIAIFVPIFTYFLIALIQRLLQKTAIKEAKKLLKQLQTNDSLTPLEKVCELSILLRRVAVSYHPEVSGLTGRAWLDYLDGSLKSPLFEGGQGGFAPFKNGIGHCLVDAPYQKELPADTDLIALFKLAQTWLNAQTSNSHRRKKIV